MRGGTQRPVGQDSTRRASRIGPVSARRLVVAALVLVLAVTALSGVSHANEHGEVAVEQDGVCRVVDPVSTDQTASEFYEYSGGSTPYSSEGTVAYQQNDSSILLFHDGPDGLSLIIVHDRYPGDAGDNGTDGGTASFDVSGLPTDGEWSVEDDDYDAPTYRDQFTHDGSESELNWIWSTARTDGAAFTGLEPGSAIRIDPAFNEDAALEPTEDGERGVISSWQAIDNTESGFERRALSSLEEPVYIWVGSCDQRPGPDASLDVTSTAASVGETVTLDASESQSVRSISEYRWDLTGDGAVDSVTTEPSVATSFNESGTYGVSVTVVDETNATGTANATVAVGSGGGPTAQLNVTERATTGETVQFDANGSTVDEPPATYEWRVDDQTVATTNESTFAYAFESAGERTVEVVVSDAVGRTDAANATVTVSEPLSAAFSAPEDPVDVGASLTFDASNSTGGVSSYAWSFGDGNGTETNESSVAHTYQSPGEYQVTLTVTNESGATAQASESVLVERPSPTAAIDGPSETTVGSSITFDASNSVASTGNLSYEWRVDGSTVVNESGPTFTTRFNDSGNHTVSVVVTDGTTRSATASAELSVVAPLTAVIEAQPAEPTVNESVTFDGRNSTGEIERYEWTLVDAEPADGSGSDGNESDADGNESADSGSTVNRTVEGPVVSHTYQSTGDYEVILTVTDGSATTTASTTISVGQSSNETTDNSDEDGSSGNSGDGSNSGGDAPSGGGSSGGAPSGGGGSGGGGSSAPDPAEPNLLVTGIEASDAVADRPFDITVSVRNDGDLEGTSEIPVTIDAEEHTTLSVTLAPGENVTRTVSATVSDPSTIDIAAGSASTSIEVVPAEADLELTAVELERNRITVGDDAVVFATVRNNGTIPGEYRAELAVSGSLSAVEVVRVMPGETERIRLAQRFEAPGTYNVSVAEQSAQVTVESGEAAGGGAAAVDDDSGAAATPAYDETDQSTDGFGVTVTVLAVLGAALVAVGRSWNTEK